MKCLIINGPNLNLLGKREPEVYGNLDFDKYLSGLKEKFSNLDIDYYQSNVEGEIVNRLQKADGQYAGIVLNAASYTHTSIAITDAIAAISTPVVEVHISNIMNREEYRKVSLVAAKCVGTISGFGLKSYDLALEYLLMSAE